MSLREQPVIADVPALIKQGKHNTPTEASVDVGHNKDVVTLSQVARRSAAQDVEITSRLTVGDARELRERLDAMIERAERYE